MPKYLPLEKKFSVSTVSAVLRTFHQIARSGEKPFPISKAIMAKLDSKSRLEVKRAKDVVDIVCWARSLYTRLQKGNTPRDKIALDPNVRALLPLPVIYRSTRQHAAAAKRRGTGETKTSRPRQAKQEQVKLESDLNLIVTTKGQTMRIEIETDIASGKRMLATMGWE